MHVAVRTPTSTQAAAATVQYLCRSSLERPPSCTRPSPSAAAAAPPAAAAAARPAAAAAAAAAAATSVRRMSWFAAQQRSGADRALRNSAAAGSSTSRHVRMCNSSSRRSMLMSGAGSVCLAAGILPLGWSGAKAATGARNMATAATSGTAGADTGVSVVYVTAPSADVAGSIAGQLVSSKLAACVNILPGITSVYTWKGKVEKDPEVLMIIKTQSTLLGQLTAKVKELHPYDEPEVVGLPVVGGSASYLKWVTDSTTQ